MGLNSTPASERVHIGFFGIRNAGKSSLVNRITNQDMSVVSDVKGTTTDAVRKSMELLPLGAVVIIDTPGFDDEGDLGEKRVESARKILTSCNIAVLVTENEKLNPDELELLKMIKKRDIPYIIVHNKSDLTGSAEGKMYVSAVTGEGIERLKEELAKISGTLGKEIHFISDFIKTGDTVVLVCPIDESAPKARLILPQQQAVRDVIDAGGIAIVIQPEQITDTLNNLTVPPALVVTDSQAFKEISSLVPENIKLTSFSVLMARYKGFLDTAVKGAETINTLKEGARILISEGCTHHRQCNDIGTVKLPRWLRAYAGCTLNFEYTSGHGFPKDLSGYDLVIHCGGCMLNDAEIKSRMDLANEQKIPFTNYGTVIAKINGILDRSIEIIN